MLEISAPGSLRILRHHGRGSSCELPCRTTPHTLPPAGWHTDRNEMLNPISVCLMSDFTVKNGATELLLVSNKKWYRFLVSQHTSRSQVTCFAQLFYSIWTFDMAHSVILIFNLNPFLVCFLYLFHPLLPTSLPSQWSANSHGGQYAVPVAAEIHCSSHGVGAHHRSLGRWGIW